MSKQREIYIDNLRIFLTILVVFHHAAITYGAPGGWYYTEKGDESHSDFLLTAFVATNQSFFMGMFFFLSAYFTMPSLQRKGPKTFTADRLKRLGIPIVFYSLLLSPVTIYLIVTLGHNASISFVDYYMGRENWIALGVLWFTAALLLFNIILVLVNSMIPLRTISQNLASNKTIFLFAIILGVISFLVRVVFPIGWTLEPLGFQLAHFTQYIAMFIIGIIAFQNKWPDSLSVHRHSLWMKLALLLVIIGLPAIFLLKELTESDIQSFLGGFTVQSFVNAIWEQLSGIAIIISLLLWAKHKWNVQNRVTFEMSRSAYAAYVIHPLILVLISLLLKELQADSSIKFALTGSLSAIFSFVAGMCLVRIPGIKDIL